QNGQIKPEPSVSGRWENGFYEDALLAILNKYNLQLIYDPKTCIACITTKAPNAPQFYVSPEANDRIGKLLLNTIGTNAIASQSFALLVKSPTQIKATRIILKSGKAPTDKEIIALFTQL